MENVTLSQGLSYGLTPLDLPACIAVVEAGENTIPL